jgi:hypothetical protein
MEGPPKAHTGERVARRLNYPRWSRSDATCWAHAARRANIDFDAVGTELTRVTGAVCSLTEFSFQQTTPHDDQMQTALAILDVAGVIAVVTVDNRWLRAIAIRLLGGPVELALPRRATQAEVAIAIYVIASILHRTGSAAHVSNLPHDIESGCTTRSTRCTRFAVASGGQRYLCSLTACYRSETSTRIGPFMAPSWWHHCVVDWPVIAAEAAIDFEAWNRVKVGDVVTVTGLGRTSGDGALRMHNGWLPLQLFRQGDTFQGRIDSSYALDMTAVPEMATVPVSVQIGSVSLSLARLSMLAIGDIIELQRPAEGPFELRVANAVVGHCELLEVDGELAVRVLAIAP